MHAISLHLIGTVVYYALLVAYPACFARAESRPSFLFDVSFLPQRPR